MVMAILILVQENGKLNFGDNSWVQITFSLESQVNITEKEPWPVHLLLWVIICNHSITMVGDILV